MLSNSSFTILVFSWGEKNFFNHPLNLMFSVKCDQKRQGFKIWPRRCEFLAKYVGWSEEFLFFPVLLLVNLTCSLWLWLSLIAHMFNSHCHSLDSLWMLCLLVKHIPLQWPVHLTALTTKAENKRIGLSWFDFLLKWLGSKHLYLGFLFSDAVFFLQAWKKHMHLNHCIGILAFPFFPH